MDAYQAVYDAVRSRIGQVDAYEAIKRAASEAFDLGLFRQQLTEQVYLVADSLARPSAVFRPALSQDGDKWCFLFGDDLQSGVAGFGDTPEEAAQAFDKAWRSERCASSRLNASAEGGTLT